MKRTFLARRNALFTSASFSAGTVAVAAAVFILAIRLLFPNFFWTMLTPAFWLSSGIDNASHGFFSGFKNTAALSLRNEALESENAALLNENRALADKAGALESLSGGIPAGVISRPPTSPYDTLIVAAGRKSDVAVGMETFGPGGVPVGVVTDVLPDFSRVTLFSSPTLSFDAWIGSKHVPVTITGAGGGAFRATLPRGAEVSVGDVVTVAVGGAAPLGTVVRVVSDPSSPAATLSIQGALSPFSLTWVSLRDTGDAFVNALSWKNADSL
ncbi:MAG TPA: rod shape-determining protein MreC [Candidatus Paceibacterota bacterium]|nr:rod shape-determining protein MreC [Candidatus Paceibacterota bacterium]